MDHSARADVATGTITRTVSVAAPQARTWEALTDPAAIEQWWGHPAAFPDGMHDGAVGTFEWVGHGPMPIRIERFDAPERFHFLWGELGDDEPGDDASPVRFDLAADGPDRTLVTVVESGFDRLPPDERGAAMAENVAGWTTVLDGFVRFVEGEMTSGG